MFARQKSKWFYAVAGSGVVLGLFNYFKNERKTVKTGWTTNFEPSVKWDYNWDKRNVSNLAKPKTDEKDAPMEVPKRTARRHIFLIMHGQYNTSANTDAKQGLTDIGKLQADLVGRRLKDLKRPFTKLVRSTMTRAQETSNIILKHIPDLQVEDCDLLREGAPILPEPPPIFVNEISPYVEKDGARIEAAFEKYFHRPDPSQTSDSFEIMVCHANVIRYFICRLLQFPPQAWLRFQLLHCSITWVDMDPKGEAGVFFLGDSGFLPIELISG